MKRLMASIGLVIAMGTVITVSAPPEPSFATWVGTNCHNSQADTAHVRRKDAQAYAEAARHEGYEWGGGCWNDNNRDDTPNAPDSSGEGPDCSGLVFKSWQLRNTDGDTGSTWYDKFMNIHGKYVAASYKYPGSSYPFVKLPDKKRTTTQYMDAFASDTHVAMLWTGAPPGDNTDYVVEALGDAYGTNVFLESYRYDSRYVAARRKNWTPDCYPRCQGSERIVMMP